MKKLQIFSMRFFQHHLFFLCLLAGGLLLLGSSQSVSGQDIPDKGKRPYELEWAGRFTDDHEPLVDFENMEGWTVEANGGSAEIGRSEEQKIWGIYTGKITFTGNTAGAGFVIRPPRPIKISGPFTAVNMWVWNDYWDGNVWKDDANNPMVSMSLLLETTNGQSFEIEKESRKVHKLQFMHQTLSRSRFSTSR